MHTTEVKEHTGHCCGGHHARCNFGRPHQWTTWYEDGVLVGSQDWAKCYKCGGTCTAEA